MQIAGKILRLGTGSLEGAVLSCGAARVWRQRGWSILGNGVMPGSARVMTSKESVVTGRNTFETRLVNSLSGHKEGLSRDRALTWYTVMGITDIDDKIIARAKAEGLKGVAGADCVSKKYEELFLRDMKVLGVLPPDALTRVSEFVPDIVRFISDLKDAGFAYTGQDTNTVWFDTTKYGSRYGVLDPSRGFGCVDHNHQNEALFNSDRWVQHWVHVGQLSIQGLKMSKSLKNYISIDSYLNDIGTANLWRIFCLLHKYSSDVEWSAAGETEAKAWDKSIASFFKAVEPYTGSHYGTYEDSKSAGGGGASLRWGSGSIHMLNDAYVDVRLSVDVALRDDVDTPLAMRKLKHLMGTTQHTLVSMKNDGVPPSAAWPLITNVAYYVQNTLESWGLDCSHWTKSSRATAEASTSQDAEKVEMLLEAVLELRDKLRGMAVARKKEPGGKQDALAGSVLQLCDELRDVTLPKLGIDVQDRNKANKK